MTYTIKEVSEMTNLSIYTLRFYDKQGLLPFVRKNQSGYREFTDSDLNLIHTICCLKNTGMAIKEIKTYIRYVMEGTESIPERIELLQAHREKVQAQQALLAENLKEIDFKLAKYRDPNAAKIVQTEINYVNFEKQLTFS